MRKRFLYTIFIALVLCAWVTQAAALSVSLNEKYTTGEPAVILITAAPPIKTEDFTISIQKPNNTTAQLSVRQEKWNKPDQCFNTFTVDRDGTFQVTVTNKATGESATASFTSGIFSRGSQILYMISVAILAICMAYWYVALRKHETGKAV